MYKLPCNITKCPTHNTTSSTHRPRLDHHTFLAWVAEETGLLIWLPPMFCYVRCIALINPPWRSMPSQNIIHSPALHLPYALLLPKPPPAEVLLCCCCCCSPHPNIIHSVAHKAPNHWQQLARPPPARPQFARKQIVQLPWTRPAKPSCCCCCP